MFSSSIHCNAGGAECVDYIHPQCQSLSGFYQHSGIRPLRGPVEHALPRDSWYRWPHFQHKSLFYPLRDCQPLLDKWFYCLIIKKRTNLIRLAVLHILKPPFRLVIARFYCRIKAIKKHIKSVLCIAYIENNLIISKVSERSSQLNKCHSCGTSKNKGLI